jgi:hypothetical protein
LKPQKKLPCRAPPVVALRSKKKDLKLEEIYGIEASGKMQ